MQSSRHHAGEIDFRASQMLNGSGSIEDVIKEGTDAKYALVMVVSYSVKAISYLDSQNQW